MIYTVFSILQLLICNYVDDVRTVNRVTSHGDQRGLGRGDRIADIHILGTELHRPAKREGNGRNRRADCVERAMAESEGEVVFTSVQEELEYWKERALEYRQR